MNKQLGAASLILLLFAGGSAWGQSGAALADAAEKMDRTKIADLLKQGADVNAAQADGMTALHWAAYHDDARMTALLINGGANAKAANRYGVTPLSLACTNGNTEIVELLLKAGADPNGALRGGETALMTAARTGKPGPVKALLARGADVNAKDRKGQTALMWAAADGHADAVATLLAAGADFRTPLASGFTPLLFAAREGRSDVVRMLLKAGADVNEAIQPQKTPSRGARAGTSALLMAVENGHFELALALVKAGADPNDQRSGCAALHMISWVRKPNRGDSEDGDPPPIGSGKLTSLEFVKEIVAYGAKVNLPQKGGVPGRGILGRVGATPLIAAASTSDVALVKTLIDLGADPQLANADRSTPLLAAAGIGIGAPEEAAGSEPEALEVLALLVKLGADVNAVDKNGETAMHGAAYRNHPKVVQLLADNGAKIDVWYRKNRAGLTPLVIAEGHRPGLNFRPSPPTVAAFHRVLRAAGVTPPKSSVPPDNLVPYEGKTKKAGSKDRAGARIAKSEAIADISAPIRRLVEDREVAGAVTLVATPDRIIHLDATGKADLGADTLMAPNAIFWIASMTKPILGLLLLMLQDEGLLSVDDPVEKHLPEFKRLTTKDGLPARVTIRHLLTHTSGMGEITPDEARPIKDLAGTIPLYVAKPVAFEPGTKWVYCQSGINTAARIIEVVAGMPFDEFAQKRLFGPLGMKDTTFYLTEAQLPRLARSYKRTETGELEATEIRFLNGKAPTSRDRFPAANGGLFSTAPDYARFCQMILNGGTHEGKRYLKAESIQLMSTIHTGSLKTGFTPGNGWGLGWCVVREPQGVTAMLSPGSFGHGGAYGTQAWIDPGKKRIYILMVQRANFTNSDASEVRRAFQDAASSALDRVK